MNIKIRKKKLKEKFINLKNDFGFKTNTGFLSQLLTCLEENTRLRKENELLRTKKALQNEL